MPSLSQLFHKNRRGSAHRMPKSAPQGFERTLDFSDLEPDVPPETESQVPNKGPANVPLKTYNATKRPDVPPRVNMEDTMQMPPVIVNVAPNQLVISDIAECPSDPAAIGRATFNLLRAPRGDVKSVLMGLQEFVARQEVAEFERNRFKPKEWVGAWA